MSSWDENNEGPSSEYQENLDLLRQTYFFGGLPLESLKVFAYLGTRELFRRDEALFCEDDDGGEAFCIIAGRAQLERGGPSGARRLREFGPGAFVGGLTLLGESRRLYTLRALEDTLCLMLRREKFAKALQQFPGQMPRLFRAVVEAVHRWEEDFLAEMTGECSRCLGRLGVSVL